MSILQIFAEYLEEFDALAPYCANGIYTDALPSSTGCALCDSGIAAAVTDISGMRTEAHNYALVLHCATLCEADRVQIREDFEALSEALAYADSHAVLPILGDDICTDGVSFLGASLLDRGDSGLSTYQIELQLQFTIERTT